MTRKMNFLNPEILMRTWTYHIFDLFIDPPIDDHTAAFNNMNRYNFFRTHVNKFHSNNRL